MFYTFTSVLSQVSVVEVAAAGVVVVAVVVVVVALDLITILSIYLLGNLHISQTGSGFYRKRGQLSQLTGFRG